MNKPVTLFVIPFLLVQVRSATIPANVGQIGAEGLEDLSQRYYLAGHPHFQNTIVGASLKRNLEKLCVQCKQSPLCRGKEDCEHCVKYCQPYGSESDVKTSAEEVGIAREPENDMMRNEADRDMTLVSRFSNGNGMAEDSEREEPNARLQMIHNPMAEEDEEETVVGSNRDPKLEKGENSPKNYQDSRYYTVGVIKPGLLMNIMLKLINVKQTNDMEKAVILVKSKKNLPITVGAGEKIDIEFLRMLGRELETAEKIHGGSPLEAEDINKILETAYEKAEFKSKSEAQIVSESDDSIPKIPSEHITRFDDKIVSSTNNQRPIPAVSEKEEYYKKSPPAELHEMEEQNLPTDDTKGMHDKTTKKLRNNNADVNMNILSETRGENLPQAMRYVESANLESSKDGDIKPQQNIPMELGVNENFESKLESKQDLLDMDSESGEDIEENENARTFHHKKYKKKKKKGHMNSYGHSYGNYNYHNEAYGYRRSNDDHDTLETHMNQATHDALTGSQQESLRPLNEDRIGAKDDFQRDQKGLTYKGQGGLHKDLENSKIDYVTGSQQESHQALSEDRIEAKDDLHRHQEESTYAGKGSSLKNQLESQRSNIDELTGSQQESLRPQNEDRIGAKDDFQRDQKGFIYKGLGGQGAGQGSSLKNQVESQRSNIDELTRSQQESLRPQNEDRIGAKDDFQRDQKGFIYKGLGGQGAGQGSSLKNQVESQRSNIDELTGSQQESLRPQNEDRIGAKDDFQRDQKGFIYKGLGGLLKDQPKPQKTRNNAPLINEQDESFNVPDPTRVDEDIQRDSGMEDGNRKDSAHPSSEGIAQIHLSEQNKKLDPKKVAIAQPNEDSHDGMPDPFHTRIHAHFNKIQEYFDNQSGTSSKKTEPIVSMAESENLQNSNDDNSSPDIHMQSRNNEENFDRQANIRTENLKMADSRETQETFSKLESSAVKKELIDDMPRVGASFQPDNLINLRMTKQENMKGETSEDMPKVGLNIEPQDLIILQKEKEDNLNSETLDSEGSSDLRNNLGDTQNSKVKSAENFDGEFPTDNRDDAVSNDIVITDNLQDKQNPINTPQFTTGDKNLPGQTVIQVDDQLIDVPNEGKSIFQVNSKPMAFAMDEDGQEQEKIFINAPTRDIGEGENVGAINAMPLQNLRVNPQIMVDESGQNLGLSANRNDLGLVKKLPFAFKKEKEFRPSKIMYTGNEDTERSSTNEKKKTENEEHEFPTPNKIPMKKHPFAPAFEGFRSPKIINTAEEQVGSELSSSTDAGVEITETSTQNIMEIVGDRRGEYENAIEKKIEKLITPREQEFLHNFGKIVPSIEKMHLNSKSDIFFMGNGIKLPLKMSPNEDGSISLSVDLEKLCKCRNSTCSHKIDMFNKLDGNLMNISNNFDNSQLSIKEKHDDDMENTTEKKIRKPRNHMDLSKLYKTYRKKYHRLHRRSLSNEHFSRFKEIEQRLERKLEQLNENVKKSNREYDNMLQKGTKDLLQVKEEHQVVKQRMELVDDLLKWMKEMASEFSNANDEKSNLKEVNV